MSSGEGRNRVNDGEGGGIAEFEGSRRGRGRGGGGVAALEGSLIGWATLQSNNFVLLDGVAVEILKIEWIDEKSWAQISYRTRGNWAQNKTFIQQIN